MDSIPEGDEDVEVEHIMVTAFVRPFSNREIKAGEECVVRIVDEHKVLIRTEHGAAEYTFDFACWGDKEIVCESSLAENTGQLGGDPDSRSLRTLATAWISEVDTIYQAIGEPLVENMLAGYNNCIFAYGATGSGKTSSLFGRSFVEKTGDADGISHKGLLIKICTALFDELDEVLLDGGTVTCEASFCEVYEEDVYDLLAPKMTKSNKTSGKTKVRGPPLQVIETAQYGVHVPHLSLHEVISASDVSGLIEWGVKTRLRGTAEFTPDSARSHCILTLRVTIGLVGASETRHSQIHFVDFAGSDARELMRKTKKNEHMDAHKGLLTFKKTIRALSVGSMTAPFGDSTLTRLLQDSFAGNCKTVMIATISPGECDVRDTLATVRFAKCVKRIKTYAAPSVRVAGDATRLTLADDAERLRGLLAAVHIDHIASDPDNLISVDGHPYSNDLVNSVARLTTHFPNSEEVEPSDTESTARAASPLRLGDVHPHADGRSPSNLPVVASEHRLPTEPTPATSLRRTATEKSGSLARPRAGMRGPAGDRGGVPATVQPRAHVAWQQRDTATKKDVREESVDDSDVMEEKPYLLNMSDDPVAHNGQFVVLFFEKDVEVTVGSGSENDVCINERGIAPYMCTLINKGNCEVTLTLDAPATKSTLPDSVGRLRRPSAVGRKRKQGGGRRRKEEEAESPPDNRSQSPHASERHSGSSPSSARGAGSKRRILLTKERLDDKPEKKWMTSGRVYSLVHRDILTFGGSLSLRLIMPRKALAGTDDKEDNASSTSSTAADFPRLPLTDSSSSADDSMSVQTENDDDVDASGRKDAMPACISVWARMSSGTSVGKKIRSSGRRKKRKRGNAALHLLLDALKCGTHNQAYVTTKWCALDLYARTKISPRAERDAKWSTMAEAFLTQMARVVSLVEECHELTRVVKPESQLHFSLGVLNDFFTYTQTAPTLVVCAWKNNRRGMAYWRYVARTKVMGRQPEKIGGPNSEHPTLSLRDAVRQLVSGTRTATLEDIVAVWDLWEFRRRLLMMRQVHERAMVKGLGRATDYMMRNAVINDPWLYCSIEQQVALVGDGNLDRGQQRWKIDKVVDHYNTDVTELREADKSGRALDTKIRACNEEMQVLQKKLEATVTQTERNLGEARNEVEGMSAEVAERVKYLETEIDQENELQRVALRELKKETDEWDRRIRDGEIVTRKDHEQLVEDAVRNTLFFDLHRYIGFQHHERELKKCQARAKEWKQRVDRLRETVATDYVTREEHISKREELMEVAKQWIKRTHAAAQESIDSESLHLHTMVDSLNRTGRLPQPSGNSKTRSSRS
eukprot:GEMP01002406.1.p1 GENE.GEMP01002406.1~~GEMP01002406.1.p1  ORF type:complete len:1319 (+),score=339.97 GEMP01002406.1:168-4124(+)